LGQSIEAQWLLLLQKKFLGLFVFIHEVTAARYEEDSTASKIQINDPHCLLKSLYTTGTCESERIKIGPANAFGQIPANAFGHHAFEQLLAITFGQFSY